MWPGSGADPTLPLICSARIWINQSPARTRLRVNEKQDALWHGAGRPRCGRRGREVLSAFHSPVSGSPCLGTLPGRCWGVDAKGAGSGSPVSRLCTGSEHSPRAEPAGGAGTASERVGARSQRGPSGSASLSEHLL